MTDKAFAKFCSRHPDRFVEISADDVITIAPPNYSMNGVRNQNINFQLDEWALSERNGVATAATAGFKLPSGARRSADSAWTRKARILALSALSRQTFWHLCPDFVIESRSHFETLPSLREKMQEWIANGAELGWLIDPERLVVEIYRPDREPETLDNPEKVLGKGPVEGFVLVMKKVWNPLGR